MAPAHTSVGSLGTVLAGREADRGAALNVAAEGTRRRGASGSNVRAESTPL